MSRQCHIKVCELLIQAEGIAATISNSRLQQAAIIAHDNCRDSLAFSCLFLLGDNCLHFSMLVDFGHRDLRRVRYANFRMLVEGSISECSNLVDARSKYSDALWPAFLHSFSRGSLDVSGYHTRINQ